MAQYHWQGMTRKEVSGTVRRRLRALAASRSRFAPLAYNVRAMNAAAVDRAEYARTRNEFFRDMHGHVLAAARLQRQA